jgi:hypothetical protein
VRLAALAAMHARGRAPEGDALDRALEEAAAGEDASARRTAREELRALLLASAPDAAFDRRLDTLARLLAREEDREETAEALAGVAQRRGAAVAAAAPALLAFCADERPRVRAALLRFAGHAGLRDQAPFLLSHLGVQPAELSAAAREGLLALGPQILDALIVEVGFGMRSKRDAALAIVRELRIDHAMLRTLYQQELATIRNTLLKLAALSGGSAPAFVQQRLEERFAECLRTALRYLAAAHDDDRIAELGELLPRADTHSQHAILVEALEALLSPRENVELVSLLEDSDFAGRGAAAARALEVEVPSRETALRSLHEDPDELVRVLAAAGDAAGALAVRAKLADPTRVPAPVEIMLHLRSLPIFERLTTRQLMDLALVVREEEHAAGTTIVREGDFSDCIYLVVDGRVRISKSGMPLAELGPKSFFGEVAIFEGTVRTATADAAITTRLLRLSRNDLLRLMEEFPGIAISVCQNLSRRLRELTDQISG